MTHQFKGVSVPLVQIFSTRFNNRLAPILPAEMIHLQVFLQTVIAIVSYIEKIKGSIKLESVDWWFKIEYWWQSSWHQNRPHLSFLDPFLLLNMWNWDSPAPRGAGGQLPIKLRLAEIVLLKSKTKPEIVLLKKKTKPGENMWCTLS